MHYQFPCKECICKSPLSLFCYSSLHIPILGNYGTYPSIHKLPLYNPTNKKKKKTKYLVNYVRQDDNNNIN